MQADNFMVSGQHSWYGFFQLLGNGWLSTGAVRMLTLTATIASLALLVSLSRATRSNRPVSLEMQLSALIVVTLLTSPHLFYYDLLMAALPAVLWWKAVRDQPHRWETTLIKLVLVLGFYCQWLPDSFSDGIPVQRIPLLLLVWLVLVVRSGRPLDTTAPERIGIS
jgi:hypothetical protein